MGKIKKIKINTKNVGASIARLNFEEIADKIVGADSISAPKENKGITLIALIITIIVMLILVAVTISILVKSNIIGIAESAADKTKTAYEKESNLKEITIGNKTYGSVEDYIAGEEEWEPTNPEYFTYTYNEETKTATITGVKEEYSELGYYSSYSYALYIKDGEKEITDIIIPSEIDINGVKYTVTEIGDNAFGQAHESWGEGADHCKNPEWTSISIPKSVTSIGKDTFNGCVDIEKVTIPSSVTSIKEKAFYYCSSLTSIEIPSSVTSIEYSAFYGCSSLTSIEIPASVTSIGACTFYGCSSLTSIEIPASVTRIEHRTFYECSNLTSIEIPSSVTSIEYSAFLRM